MQLTDITIHHNGSLTFKRPATSHHPLFQHYHNGYFLRRCNAPPMAGEPFLTDVGVFVLYPICHGVPDVVVFNGLERAGLFVPRSELITACDDPDHPATFFHRPNGGDGGGGGPRGGRRRRRHRDDDDDDYDPPPNDDDDDYGPPPNGHHRNRHGNGSNCGTSTKRRRLSSQVVCENFSPEVESQTKTRNISKEVKYLCPEVESGTKILNVSKEVQDLCPEVESGTKTLNAGMEVKDLYPEVESWTKTLNGSMEVEELLAEVESWTKTLNGSMEVELVDPDIRDKIPSDRVHFTDNQCHVPMVTLHICDATSSRTSTEEVRAKTSTGEERPVSCASHSRFGAIAPWF